MTAPPQFDHGDLVAKLADPLERFDEYIRFFNRFFHGPLSLFSLLEFRCNLLNLGRLAVFFMRAAWGQSSSRLSRRALTPVSKKP